jgi:hypothetical protein
MAEEEVDELAEALAAADAEEGDGELAEEAVEEEEEAAEEAAEEVLEDEPEIPDEEVPMEGEDEVQEHLKEAVEGSFQMKRLLLRDDGPAAKKSKTPADLIRQKLIMKWGMQGDEVVRHTLKNLALRELETMEKSSFIPDKLNQFKSPAELLARHASDCRERHCISGGPIDCLLSFKYRHKLSLDQVNKLRALSHKDLRYVIQNYDGEIDLETVISDAADHVPEEQCTENAMPAGLGVQTLGRFTRLELIDPVADAAVFGDANLTFALKLAKHRKALGHVGRVIATTFEDLPTLRERYKEIDESIATLEDLLAEVFHSVDCTRIAIDPQFEGLEDSLGSVYYNFPHSGAVGGFFDGHPLVNWRHENLMRLFFRALRAYMKPGGQVKVASNMGAVGVRFSYIVESAIENEFVHVETMPFMEWHLHRYGRSYGDRRDAYKRPDSKNNQSYNAQNANADMVYCFAYAPTGDPIGEPNIRIPPSLKTLTMCTDGPFKNLGPVPKDNLAKQLHKRFVTEASGIHVG